MVAPGAPAVDDRPGRTGLRRRTFAGFRSGLAREVVAFGAIGIVSTAAYAVLYLVLRTLLGPTAANATALILTAVGNTTANRRLTFRVRSRGSMLRDQLAGFVALGIALAITTLAITGLGALVPHAARLLELAVLVVANAAATLVRFLVLRAVIAGRPLPGARPAPAVPNQHWSQP
jgi:putative flippase GtrA